MFRINQHVKIVEVHSDTDSTNSSCSNERLGQELVSAINIDDLPYELLIEIFSYLSVEDLALQVRKVSRKWEELAEDNRLWKHLTYTPSHRHTELEIIDVLKQAPKLQRFIPPYHLSRKRFFQTIAEHCKDMRVLAISAEEDKDTVEKLVSECQNMESFTVHSHDFSKTKILQIVSKFQNLKNLKLTGDMSVRNHNIFADISLGCPSLDTLDLQHLSNYSNNNLEFFLKEKKDKILCLYLECCRPREPCSLPMIFELCTTLQHLKVRGHAGTTSSKELISLKKMKNLKSLFMDHFVYYKINHLADYLQTQYARNLVCLSLGRFSGSVEELSNCICMNCCKLKHLNLGHCPRLRDDGLKFIGNLRDLRKLYLVSCCCLTDEGVSYIVRCTQISYLNLNGCGNISHDGFVLCLENLKMLNELCIDACRMEPHALMRVPQELKNLRKLKIRHRDEREMNHVISALRKNVPYLQIQ
ncbi:hypothetical protein R5R35_003484 [Gryllus longicercus]|uniref:F-box domain-containing protein n=1 Tax=Gryllus longicercus TaxID=2509291 RepID=A0AAN9ZAM0_9ORTH